MQFQVPQFIDVEDKIFGPLTFKQFIYLAGGAGVCYLIYKILPFFLAILIILPVIALVLGLAFYKINNKALIFTLEAGFNYVRRGKIYIWKKEPKKIKELKTVGIEKEPSFIPKLAGSKLQDISWSLDVLDVDKNKNNENKI